MTDHTAEPVPSTPADPLPEPCHLTLGDVIERLRKEPDQSRLVRLGWREAYSYRGYYEQLAFELAENVTVADMLACAENARGRMFYGWKGGEFTMDVNTDVWLVSEPRAIGETLGAVLLELLLRHPEPAEPLAQGGIVSPDAQDVYASAATAACAHFRLGSQAAASAEHYAASAWFRAAVDAAYERGKAEQAAEVEQLRYERRLLGSARMTMDLIAAGTPDRWDGLRAEAERTAQAIVDEIRHPVTDEPALGPDLRAERDRLLEIVRGKNGEIERLQLLLEQAEQYARDLQDDGVALDDEELAVANRGYELAGLVHQFFHVELGDNCDPLEEALGVLREAIGDYGVSYGLVKRGIAEGLRQATEGWERRLRWRHASGTIDEAPTEPYVANWLKSIRRVERMEGAAPGELQQRLVGPWEPAPTEPAAALESGADAPTQAGGPVVHRLPPEGSGRMPCCGRTPFEVPLGDRLVATDMFVTCRGRGEPAEQPEPARCCDLHGRNCEQGGEECCERCTEAHHFAPGHGGVPCSAPDLSAGWTLDNLERPCPVVDVALPEMPEGSDR